MKPQLTAYPALASRMNTGLCAFEAIHPLADSATRPLARPTEVSRLKWRD
ncbi:MAG: hypothetical protein Q8N89_01320 [Azonexus sp.]|nr:hypothetical protein [Azonexus sp.]